MRNDAPLMERLSAKATWQPNGCWEWNKPQPSGLCGTLMVDDPVSGKRRQIMASVVSWLNKHGSMPRDQVANIRSRHAAGGITAALIARDYGVSPTTVVRILQGKTWKHGGRV